MNSFNNFVSLFASIAGLPGKLFYKYSHGTLMVMFSVRN